MTKRKVSPLFAVVALGVSTPAVAGGDDSWKQKQRPRTLPSGAPACGNTQSKKPVPCTTEAPPAPTPIVAVQPRTLPSGAPACGNVLDKVNGDRKDPVYLSCLKGEQPGVELAERMARQRVMERQVVHRVLSLLGITPVNATVAEPRRMRNGAPACGNVATRSGYRTRTSCD
jgi:hypothetical protein